MRFLFVGSHLCTWASFRHALAGLPLPSASGYPVDIGSSHRGLSPHKLMPMSGVHIAFHRTRDAARGPVSFELGVTSRSTCRGSAAQATEGDTVIHESSRRAVLNSLVALAAGAAIANVSDYAHAQQRTTPWRIGVLTGGKWPEETMQEFRQALVEAGYSEGRDVVIEWRPASGNFDRLPELAAELVQRKVDVIVVDSTLATRALKRATPTIPIVMAFVSDPVGSGLVPSLVHPGGNVTGLSMMTTELSVKRLQLLKEALPRLTRVAVLWNPDTPSHGRSSSRSRRWHPRCRSRSDSSPCERPRS